MSVNLKYISFLFFVLSLFFIPHWLKGEVYGTFDLSSITIPLEDIFARYQKQGIVPVWVPEIQAGYPLVANAIQSFFYLPHVVLRQIFSGVWVANLSLLLHMWLAGFGMMVLLQSLGFRRFTAVIGALVFAGGGYFIGRITLPHLFFPVAWIPLILWSQVRALERPKLKNSILFAVLIALQIFSGHIQVFVYTIIIMLVVTIVYLLKGRVFPLQARWHILLVPLLVGLLAAVHLMPTVELLPQSKRTGALTGAELLDVSYPPSQLLTLVWPRIFGYQDTYTGAKNEPELMEYFGWIGLLAGMIGLFSRNTWRHPMGISALVLVVLGFLLAGGNYSPFFHWFIDHVSFWAQFGNPGRALILVHVGWIVLVAFGVERFRFRKWQAYLLFAFVSAELLFWGYGVNRVTPLAVWQKFPEALAHVPARIDAPRILSSGKLRPYVATDFSPTVGPSLDEGLVFEQTVVPQQNGWQGGRVGLAWGRKKAKGEDIYLDILDESGDSVRQLIINGTQIVVGESVLFEFPPIENSRGRTFTIRIWTNLARNSAPHVIILTNRGGFDYNPTGFLSMCAQTQCKPVTSSDWDANADLDIQLFYKQAPVMSWREFLLPLAGESTGQQMVRGHLTLQIGRMYRYMHALGERGSFEDSNLISRRDLLDRLSVGTLLASYSEHRAIEGMDGLALVSQFPIENQYAHVYRNNQAFSRIQLISSVRRVNNEEQALQLISSGELSSQEVVIEEFPEAEILASDTSATVNVQRDDSRIVEIDVRTSQKQLLVLRDAMYSGWHAFINGSEVPIYPVDSVFRGVVVPSGNHTIRFQYIPKVYNYAASVSLVSWVMAIGFLALQGSSFYQKSIK